MLCPTVYAAADSGECGCSWISRCKQRVCGSDFCSRAGRGTSYSGEGQWNRYDKRKSGKASELYSRGSRSGKKYWYCKCESENPSVLWRRVWNSDQESKTDGYRGRDHSTSKDAV